jgi:hypothetical protein
MGGLPALAAPTIAPGLQKTASRAVAKNDRWWESAAATTPIFIRPRPGEGMVFPLVPAAAASKRLDEMRGAGVAAIEVYAPAEGGNSFLGLDTINRYRFEPRAGTMDDFKRLVGLVHQKGMKIVSIDNLGYSSVEAVDFLKACDDVRAGKDTREARFYVWSDSAGAPGPAPAVRDPYFITATTKQEFWQYSERAGKYYWTKWPGVDLAGNKVRLPQYNWGSPEFHEESEKIIRFWMDTGIHGMIVDAVNWYVGCNWRVNRKYMTGVISSYGAKFSQPEGAGAFRDDPVAWVTEGGWTCIQDYGLAIFWEKGSNVVANAIETGDPRPIEPALRNYHDRVAEAGGTLYFNPPRFADARKSRLAMALAAATGELVCLAAVIDGLWSPIFPDAEESRILKWKAEHPAMHNLSGRRVLPTMAPERHYAVLRTARDGSQRAIVVMNFQAETQPVEVVLGGVDFDTMTDLGDGRRIERQPRLRLELPAYGYRFFRLAGPNG